MGGSQGQFEIIEDTLTGEPYLLSASGRLIVGVGPGELLKSEQRLVEVKGGEVIMAEPKQRRAAAPAPIPSSPADRARSRPAVSMNGSPHPLPLNEFQAYVTGEALQMSVANPVLRKQDENRIFLSRTGGWFGEEDAFAGWFKDGEKP